MGFNNSTIVANVDNLKHHSDLIDGTDLCSRSRQYDPFILDILNRGPHSPTRGINHCIATAIGSFGQVYIVRSWLATIAKAESRPVNLFFVYRPAIFIRLASLHNFIWNHVCPEYDADRAVIFKNVLPILTTFTRFVKDKSVLKCKAESFFAFFVSLCTLGEILEDREVVLQRKRPSGI